MKGMLFAFEGIDGCGKSTQVEHARGWLEQQGYRCMVSREPGGTSIGEKIRELLLSTDNSRMCDPCEVLLYCAARAQHVSEKILPALKQGIIVLCDRFELATMAYQGYGRGMPLRILRKINAFATGGCTPAMSFVFDLPVESAFRRLRSAGKTRDRLEKNSRLFFEKVRRGYIAAAACQPRRIKLIDAEKTIDEIAEEVRGVLAKVIERKKK